MFQQSDNRNSMPKPIKFLFFLTLIGLVIALVGWLIQFLWNTILVGAIGVKELSFWEAVGLFILSRILFGGLFWGRGPKKWKSHKRKAWKEKWMNMSEEERLAFKEKWKERCKRRE